MAERRRGIRPSRGTPAHPPGEVAPVKISFVIPAYNEEACIGACLESVMRALAAGDYDAEVIVVNNASTDRTGERAGAFAGVRVVDEAVKGLVRARRAGLAAARGELIASIDADTMLTDGWLDVVVEAFRRDPRLVALSGPLIYFDMPAASRALVWLFYAVAFVVHVFSQHVLHVGAMIQGGNFVARRSALEAAGGYDTSIAFYGEDTDIARRLSKVGRVKWTFRLPINSSGRRLKEEGVVKVGLRYALNFFWVILFGRPWTTTYTDVRSK